MRRTLAFFVLTTFAVISIGCAKDSQQSGNAPNDNATGTTTYSNSSVPQPTTTAPAAAPPTGATSSGNNNSSGGGAAPKTSPAKPGIKPPTE